LASAAVVVTWISARMRINRAVEKLRKIFSKRGIDSSSTAIAETISKNSIQSAPAALIHVTTTAALAKGAAGSLSATALAKATLLTMKTKTILVTAAAAAVILAAGGLAVLKLTATRAGPPETVPVKWKND